MKRGDVVIASLAGDYGKLRPALIIQNDLLIATESVLICPITSEIRNIFFRVLLEPNFENGLSKISQVMVDKTSAIARARIKQKIGRITFDKTKEIERVLLVVFGMA